MKPGSVPPSLRNMALYTKPSIWNSGRQINIRSFIFLQLLKTNIIPYLLKYTDINYRHACHYELSPCKYEKSMINWDPYLL